MPTQTITEAILDAVAGLLAGDTATINAVARPEMILSKAPFAPSFSSDPANLVAPDFVGYAPIAEGAGVPGWFVDPATGDRMVEVIEPLGGWHFETTGVTNLPQTIYGWGLTNAANTILYASGLFDAPIVLTATNQGFDVPFQRIRIPAAAFLGEAI